MDKIQLVSLLIANIFVIGIFIIAGGLDLPIFYLFSVALGVIITNVIMVWIDSPRKKFSKSIRDGKDD